ncbi:MAG TPA: hypothetical protein VF395_21225, partial [Polyangiaceae bacterium]
MAGASVILVVCLLLLALVDRRLAPQRAASEHEEEPLVQGRAFRMLVRDKYLLLIAALTLLLNWVNSNGEYVLDRTLLASLGHMSEHDAVRFIGAFKAEYFGYVNLLGVLLQMFAVSRILTRFGVRRALLILPSVALVGYGVMLVSPVLSLIRVAKVAENSLDYSVQNTSRQALFLVTSRVEKYVGKTVVDTLFVRLGDVLSAVVVWSGTMLVLPTAAFAGLNLVLIATWIVVAVATGRECDRRAAEGEERILAEPVVA